MRRFGYMYGNKGKRKMLGCFYTNEFQRNCDVMYYRSVGFRCRKINRPEIVVISGIYYGA